MDISITAHRPDKLGGYEKDAHLKVRAAFLKAFEILEPETVTVGMALGGDTAAAEACMMLHIPFIAAIPFRGQEKRWGISTQKHYQMLLKRAVKVVNVAAENNQSDEYHPLKLLKRNEWMVDHTGALLCLYNGDKKGGTAHCVQYAMKRRKPIYNAWNVFQGYQETLDFFQFPNYTFASVLRGENHGTDIQPPGSGKGDFEMDL